MATNTCKKRALQTESDDDIEQSPHFVLKGNDGFARFLVIKSMEEKAVTSLSPFVIEKQIESIIGTPKSVKKLKNKKLFSLKLVGSPKLNVCLKFLPFSALEYLSLSNKV